MPPSDLVRVRHMLDAAREAVTFAAGKTAQDLKSDRILSLALVKCIEIIGEAATKVANETRAANPQIPWADIVGMRHRLIHVYFDVDLERVCDTIAIDLPPLIESLEMAIEAKHK
jgi:uncharacterized protein with HEPN domain